MILYKRPIKMQGGGSYKTDSWTDPKLWSNVWDEFWGLNDEPELKETQTQQPQRQQTQQGHSNPVVRGLANAWLTGRDIVAPKEQTPEELKAEWEVDPDNPFHFKRNLYNMLSPLSGWYDSYNKVIDTINPWGETAEKNPQKSLELAQRTTDNPMLQALIYGTLKDNYLASSLLNKDTYSDIKKSYSEPTTAIENAMRKGTPEQAEKATELVHDSATDIGNELVLFPWLFGKGIGAVGAPAFNAAKTKFVKPLLKKANTVLRKQGTDYVRAPMQKVSQYSPDIKQIGKAGDTSKRQLMRGGMKNQANVGLDEGAYRKFQDEVMERGSGDAWAEFGSYFLPMPYSHDENPTWYGELGKPIYRYDEYRNDLSAKPTDIPLRPSSEPPEYMPTDINMNAEHERLNQFNKGRFKPRK